MGRRIERLWRGLEMLSSCCCRLLADALVTGSWEGGVLCTIDKRAVNRGIAASIGGKRVKVDGVLRCV